MAERIITLGDFCIWKKRWCCRRCRAKASTISEILHEPWCKLLQPVPGERPEDG